MEVVVVVVLELLIASLSQSLDIACLVKDLEKTNIISHFKNKSEQSVLGCMSGGDFLLQQMMTIMILILILLFLFHLTSYRMTVDSWLQGSNFHIIHAHNMLMIRIGRKP
jgi:hypothetical protein